jgi:endonuclease G
MAIEGRFARLVTETRDARARVRDLVATRRWRDAEPDRSRLARYTARAASMAEPRGREAIEGDTNDLQPAWFLPAGAKVRRAVAYVEANNAGKWSAGSGFLISPRLFLTNQHVIANESAAFATQITFDREVDDSGQQRPTSTYRLDPDRFAIFSKEEELDYALIAVGPRLSGDAALEDLGFCMMSDRPDKHAIGMNVNIIQHPEGFPKMIAVRNNILDFRTPRTLLYETDTDHGSSGSPVFNDAWELVALHHYGQPFLELKDERGNAIPTNVNEGVRISAIYDDLEARLAGLSADRQDLLRTALADGKQTTGSPVGKRLSPPRPSSAEDTALTSEGIPMAEPANNPQELRIVVPIEVTVRVGAPSAPGSVAGTDGTSTTNKILSRAAEKLAIDQDYSNRGGYDPKFIAGIALALPAANAKLAKQIAPLRPGEPNAEAGELKYEHFSIKMNKAKRIAIFTATNIDGKTYLNVDRTTGEVTDGAEGETWYKDPRVSASFFLDQTFYSAWSHLFDRGHLTRRMDPNWGTKEEAERGNADTYHFTNCSPQHFRFNESTKFWQGAEQYVLENGALTEDSQNRISVFQGPIFNDKIDLWSDDVQIPSSFFKVIVWKGKAGLRSVGLVVDQLALLSEERKGGIKPKPVEFVNVSQWRVGIAAIEERTGLDFGSAIRQADTIKDDAQPHVGEALILIRSFADLLPKLATS